MKSGSNKIGLYIHIPFCKAKCYYCDFNSFSCKDEMIAPYIDALLQEVDLYRSKLSDYFIKTVFIGGGTPSYVDAELLQQVLSRCRRSFNLMESAEISIETNPGTLSYEKLSAYRHMGINRLSIGLQAWQDTILKSIGRIHTSQEFLENFKQARKAGFDNINVDLIFGLPGQTIADWKETLEHAIELDAEHLSCYSLKIEEGTVFGERLGSGALLPADDELDREMYSMAMDILKNAGYMHYEISNFARKGYECLHNLIYWNAEEYLGLGAGSHSYLESKRYNNIYDIDAYINRVLSRCLPVEGIKEIGRDEQFSEYIILGLRMIKGISRIDFKNRFGIDIFELFGEKIDLLAERKLLAVDGDAIRLTKLGLDLANKVFVEFI